jgi:hypothetical protein
MMTGSVFADLTELRHGLMDLQEEGPLPSLCEKV